jgi:hypothetical protein
MQSHRSRRKQKRLSGGETVDIGEKLYRLSTIADKADLPIRTVREHARKGILPTVRVGTNRVKRVRESDAKRYLQSQRDGSSE